jgi:hypothetical protein
MSEPIDFHQIRTFKNTQNDAFEELCCQLAHLEKHAKGSVFWRKEGAGGDAGIECYWTNPDSSEDGWQVKYFFEIDWNQIDESVLTALTKHPKLVRYVVCLPKDLTDRRVGKNKSERDHWNEHEKKWKEIVGKKSMGISFELWGAHEISLLLTQDAPEYSGRLFYWFNKVIFAKDWFNEKYSIVKADLGERYTPELHFDLPISDTFSALSGSDDFINIFVEHFNEIKSTYVPKSIDSELNKESISTNLDALYNQRTTLIEQLEKIRINNSSFFDFNPILQMVKQNLSLCDEAQRQINGILFADGTTKLDSRSKQYQSIQDTRHSLGKYYSSLYELIHFIESDLINIFNDKKMLLTGEAGVGKSHLLADIVKNNIEKGSPSLLFLGQYYTGGNPWNSILSKYDLNCSIKEFLGALDASAECKNARCTFFIDAINEGEKRDDWINWIAGFLEEATRITRIAVCITCRSIYTRKVLGNNFSEHYNCIEHTGFEGIEYDAIKHFFSHYKIEQPSAPFLSPEFSNPLFLKTVCQSLDRQNIHSLPKGLHGITSLFALYVESLDTILERKHGIDIQESLTEKSLNEIALHFYRNKTSWITRDNLRTLLEPVCKNIIEPNIMLQFLLSEGALSETVQYEGDDYNKSDYVIRYTYERFSDHFIAKSLLDENLNPLDPSSAFTSDSIICKYLKNSRLLYSNGIVEALSIQLPEICGRELISLIPENLSKLQSFHESFLESIIWRKPSASNKDTLYWFNSVRSINIDKIEILLKTSVENEHYFNAEFLHRNLINKSLPELDSSWTVPVIKYYVHTDGRNAVDTLISWASSVSIIDYQYAKLCSIVLSWLLSSSHRKIRDTATKALANIVRLQPTVSLELLELFQNANDAYVLERVLCSIYGGILRSKIDKQLLSDVSLKIFKILFAPEYPVPNIMIRDYGRNIIEFTIYSGCIHHSVDIAKCRPPYKSSWPLNIPDKNKLEKLYDNDSICYSTIGFVNDFGNYTMSDVHHWTSTELSAERPLTCKDYLENIKQELIKNNAPEIIINGFNLRFELKAEPDLYRFIRSDLKLSSSEELESIKKEIDSTEAELEKHFGSEKWREIKYWLACNSDDPMHFKKEYGQAWVCKRAHELGWEKNLFENFERQYQTSHGRSGSNMFERIGKKYQWIAYYELLAYLADNLIHEDSLKYRGIKHFEGPWLISERNIDPTFLLEKTFAENSYKNNETHWWMPFSVQFAEMNIEEKKKWLWNNNDIPDFGHLISPKNNKDDSEWFMLECNGHWNEDHINYNETYWRDIWYRIQSCIIDAANIEIVTKYLQNSDGRDGFELGVIKPEIHLFLYEYPWHPMCRDYISDTIHKDSRRGFPADAIRTSLEYYKESGSTDYSLKENVNIMLPSPWIIDQLKLHADISDMAFLNKQNQMGFFDPTIFESGPSSALIRKNSISKILIAAGKILVWRVAGEKNVYPPSHKNGWWGRKYWNGCYWFNGKQFSGKVIIKEEKRV